MESSLFKTKSLNMISW